MLRPDRGELQGPAKVCASSNFMDLGSLVDGVVVQDQVQVQARRHDGADELEEPRDLPVPVTTVGPADYRVAGRVERREQAGRAIAGVVVRHPHRGRAQYREARCRLVESGRRAAPGAGA
jgi:hypothetical protein